MQKKLSIILFFLILVLSLWAGCSTTGVIPDTDDPDSDPIITNRVVMVELFVAPACTHCPQAKEDVAQLLEEYGLDKIVVLEEYAWNYPLTFSSGWAIPDTISRYSMYTSDTATPDAYFNGLNQTVHHDNSSYNNYKNAINAELAKPVQIAISATATKDSDIKLINITGNIQNVGDSAFSNIVIGAMIYEDSVPLGAGTANHVVRDIVTSEQIDSFSDGESLSFSLTADSEDLKYVHNFNNLHIVVYVQAANSWTREILQALYVE